MLLSQLDSYKMDVTATQESIFGTKQENGTRIVNYIKVKRLAWAGHLVRMDSDRTLKKIFNTKQMEQEVLEDRNYDGRMVLIKI